jgi:hypothetical protein
MPSSPSASAPNSHPPSPELPSSSSATLASTPPLPELSRKQKRALRSKLQSKQQKKKKRDNGAEPEPALNRSKKHFENASKIPSNLDANNFPIASTGFVGRRAKGKVSATYQLRDLIGPESEFKFTLVEWDER